MQPTTLDYYHPSSPNYRGESNPCTEERDALTDLRDMINEKLKDESAAEIFEEWTLDVLGKYRIKYFSGVYFDVTIIDENENPLYSMRRTDDDIVAIVHRYQRAAKIDTSWMEGEAA